MGDTHRRGLFATLDPCPVCIGKHYSYRLTAPFNEKRKSAHETSFVLNHIFLCHRHGVHVPRNITHAADDPIPWRACICHISYPFFTPYLDRFRQLYLGAFQTDREVHHPYHPYSSSACRFLSYHYEIGSRDGDGFRTCGALFPYNYLFYPSGYCHGYTLSDRDIYPRKG